MAAAFSAGGFGSVFGGYTAFLIKTVIYFYVVC